MHKLAAGLLSLTLTNCSLVGAGIGAAVPKYANVSDLEPVVGSETRIEDTTGHTTLGVLDGYRDGVLYLHDEHGAYTVRLADVARAEKRLGSQWQLGGAIGLKVDVLGVIALACAGVMAIAASSISRTSWSGAL